MATHRDSVDVGGGRMKTKKPTLTVKASVGSASCTVYASVDMTCPLCRATVPAKTQHTCGDGSTRAAVVAIVNALCGGGEPA